MSEIDDQQLIKNYLKGDQKSLELLIQKYISSIYGFVYKYVGNGHEADDITQEVFVRAWKNLKKFKNDGNFKSWIFSIAKNASIDYLRKRKAIPFSRFDNDDGGNLLSDILSDSSPLPDKVIDQKQKDGIVISAMEKLSDNYKKVLSLYYQESFNFRQIAESLGESINTIKNRHRRALLQLREILSD